MPTLTAAELAQLVAGKLSGDGRLVVRRVATLEEAGPDAVSWVGRAEVLPRLAQSSAGVVVIPERCEAPADRTTIRVPDPDLAICAVLEALRPPVATIPPGTDPGARVDATAEVAEARIGFGVFVGAHAVVGARTQLHPGVYVGEHCRIGRDCVLWPGVVVREYCEIGDRVVIHPNATIGADGFGYHQRGGKHVKIPQIGRVVIEDDVEIGANTCIDRARSGETRVGRGTKIDNLVQIGHNVRVGEDCLLVSQCGISGSTTLGHHVVLAGQVGVIDHLRIGNNVMVAAQSGVTSHIPDGTVYRGTPAVANKEYIEQQIGVRRLPKLVAEMRALQKRVEQLESAADDTERG